MPHNPAPLEGSTLDTITEPSQIAELPADMSPVLFMGGTFYDQEKNGEVLDHIQEETGRPTLEPLPSRQTRGTPWLNRVRTDESEEIMFAPRALSRAADEGIIAITSVVQEDRADELIERIDEQPPITLIGQSADAQPAVIAAHKRPDRIKNLILAFPNGVTKKETKLEYMGYITKTASDRDKVPGPAMRIDAENSFGNQPPSSPRELGKLMMRRFVGSGGLRALASTISGYQGGLLHEMRKRDDAPAVSMVLGSRDIGMRPDRIIESLKSANDIDFLLIVNSTHGIQGRKDLMSSILDLTDIMDARSSEREAAKARNEVFDPGPLEDRLIFLEGEPYGVSHEEQEKFKALARGVPES